MASFDLTVVAWCGDGDKLMDDFVLTAEGIEGVFFGGIKELEGKFDTVIRLKTADGEGKEAEAARGKVNGIFGA